MVLQQDKEYYLLSCLDMACENVRAGNGGPFAALVVRDGTVIGKGLNEVTKANDPTAHAEIRAIRDACLTIGDYRLEGAILYCSCEPCPMCLGAVYWANIAKVVYVASREDATEAGFDDAYIYREAESPPLQRGIPFEQVKLSSYNEPFLLWKSSTEKKEY